MDSYRLNRILPAAGLGRVLVGGGARPESAAVWVEEGWTAVCLGLSDAVWAQRQRGAKPALLLSMDSGPGFHQGALGPWLHPKLAVVLDAAAAVMRLPVVLLRPEAAAGAARTLAKAARWGAEFGLPVLAQVAVLRPLGATRYGPDPDPRALVQVARWALDLGAAGLLVEQPTLDACREIVAMAGGRPVFVELDEVGAEQVGAAGVLARAELPHRALRRPSSSGYGLQ